MQIALIGGLDRNESDFNDIAARHGHTVELHTGHMNGRGADTLRSAIARADLVVLVTEVNSHGAVQLARRLCQRAGRSPLIVRKCGAARFSQICEGMSAQQAARRAS